MQLIKSIKFKEDFRTWKAGESIEFHQGLNVLCGVNGCGKSTILDLLREHFKIKDDSYLKNVNTNVAEFEQAAEPFDVKYFDFHAGDKKYSAHFGDDMMGQIQSMKASSGIGNLIQFDRTGIKNMKDGLIILDEPDRGMALRIQRDFALLFAKLAVINNNQIIVSTHSSYIMKIADGLYSVEHKKFFENPDDFLEEHLKC